MAAEGLVAGGFTVTATPQDPTIKKSTAKGTVIQVESITGIAQAYCTHKGCSAALTAVLTANAKLPKGKAITWAGHADFDQKDGLKARALFAKHEGTERQISAKLANQPTAALSTKYVVVKHETPVFQGVVGVRNRINVPADAGKTTAGMQWAEDISVDLTAVFDHPNHVWVAMPTKVTAISTVWWRLLPGTAEADLTKVTDVFIYMDMRQCIVNGGNANGAWYREGAVREHEYTHAAHWEGYIEDHFPEFQRAVTGMTRAYSSDLDTPAKAATAIAATREYGNAVTALWNASIKAQVANLLTDHPKCKEAEHAYNKPFLEALDAKAKANGWEDLFE